MLGQPQPGSLADLYDVWKQALARERDARAQLDGMLAEMKALNAQKCERRSLSLGKETPHGAET